MEVTTQDLKELKLAPTLIIFLKCLHFKDEEYFKELSNVSDVFKMGKHLEKSMTVKIIGSNVSINSFEIRKDSIMNYFDNNSRNIEKEVDEVIEYFKKTTGKTKVSAKSRANRKYIKARLSEYSVDDLKNVIKLKNKQWKYDPSMKMYIRIATLFNDEKFQGYIGEVENDNSESRVITG